MFLEDEAKQWSLEAMVRTDQQTVSSRSSEGNSAWRPKSMRVLCVFYGLIVVP